MSSLRHDDASIKHDWTHVDYGLPGPRIVLEPRPKQRPRTPVETGRRLALYELVFVAVLWLGALAALKVVG